MNGKDVLIRVVGRMGRITMNRPEVLNALTHDMVLRITAALIQWRDDPTVRSVMIDAASERAFCAGGDIAALYDAGRCGDFEAGRAFWRDEYRLNALIAAYPKPFTAITDGLVMGGGVGVSAHGRRRIVTERTLLATPECSIGLIPDVGATYLLARAPGHCGEYIGLTGVGLAAADCIYAGFADLHVAADMLGEFKVALMSGDAESAGRLVSAPKEPSTLAERQGQIDRAFSGASVVEIDDALAGMDGDWAHAAAAKLRHGAPLSLEATLGAIRAARSDESLPRALFAEYRFVARAMEEGEFLEGVRAAVIDKDRSPKWRYPELGDVPPDLLARMRGPAPGEDQLNFGGEA